MYQIINNGASIKLVSDAGDELIMKHKIKGLVLVGFDKVRIDTGIALRSRIVDFRDVSQPHTNRAWQLAEIINTWITDCVCCDCDNHVPPPSQGR